MSVARRAIQFTLLNLIISFGASAATAQEQPAESELPPGIAWKHGPTKGALGAYAEIAVPKDYVYADAGDTKRLMQMMENDVTGTEVGLLAPKSFDWFIVFEYDNCGYVKDDERDSLDADAMLKSMQQATEAANPERIKRGWRPYHVVGWEQPPRYDVATQSLVWATQLECDGSVSVNYNTRRLGRHGVMRVTLVCDGDKLPVILPPFSGAMKGFAYTDGNRYDQFVAGDRIAEYGLTALITGGAVAVAAKAGVFKWLWKVGVVVVVAIAAMFRKIFGGGTAKA